MRVSKLAEERDKRLESLVRLTDRPRRVQTFWALSAWRSRWSHSAVDNDSSGHRVGRARFEGGLDVIKTKGGGRKGRFEMTYGTSALG